MKSACTLVLLVAALLIVYALAHAAEGSSRPLMAVDAGGTPHVGVPCRESDHGFSGEGGGSARGGRGARAVYEDTLWIFDADFEDLLGDNAGWTTSDHSGTLGYTNYWHHDTIRLTEPYLGDSTWWCGTVDPTGCWRQPRGYGNNWICILEREFPLSEWSEPGDDVVIEWDQRYAMERNYDYGYVDVSVDDSSSWTTIATYNNRGFIGAGKGADWSDPTFGHPACDLGAFAATDIRLRYRFESDEAYSCQDEYDGSMHSLLDGAWQLDNIELTVNDETHFLDDCESGNMGWIHDDIPATGQTGVTFRRSYEDLWAYCGPNRHHQGWMMVAYDTLAGAMVDDQLSWLTSPAIDIAGAERLRGRCEVGVRIPVFSDDVAECQFASSQTGCWGFYESNWRWHAPSSEAALYWYSSELGLGAYTGNDWLQMRWIATGAADPYEPHGPGLFLDRVRIGIPIGNATEFTPDTWQSFFDTFELAEALLETARVRVEDDDGITAAFLMASRDGGNTWSSYELTPEVPGSPWLLAPPPVDEIAPGTEIRYYYESVDGLGNVRTYPKNAPEATLEFSILPIEGSVQYPAVLLVDKHGRYVPNEHRDRTNTSEDYFREALDLLDLAYDVYDVRVPSGSVYSEGPDTSGMKYYSTQIWFSSDFDAYSLRRRDQWHLIEWLAEAADGKERNLLLTGNDIGKELVQTGQETLGFYSTWLGSDYVADNFGATLDTMPTLRDAAGDYDFMTHDDGACLLWDDGWG